MKTIGIIIFFIVSFACTKPEVIPVNPCEVNPCDTTTLLGKLDTLWTNFILENQKGIINQGIIFNNHHIILNYVNIGAGAGLAIIDLDNLSEKKFYTKDDLGDFGNAQIDSLNQNIILQSGGYIALIKFPNGQLLNQHQFTEGWSSNTFGQLLSHNYYISRRNEDESICYLMRSKSDDLNSWETIYTLKKGVDTGNSRPNIQSYNLWIHPQSGDSILIFQHRMALPNRIDVLAWNMKTKEVVWRHDDLSIGKNSNHQQILIVNDKAYFGGGTAFYCFDMLDGEIVWQYNHPSGTNAFGLYKTAYAEAENKIIVKDASDKLFGFNALTGAVDWVRSDAGISSVGSGSPVYYNGIVYYTMQTLLWAVRASDGAILWSERSDKPFYKTSFRGDVAIDPVRKVLYATDETRLFAIKLYGE
jgi:outer membrane protein assembly factor BamB